MSKAGDISIEAIPIGRGVNYYIGYRFVKCSCEHCLGCTWQRVFGNRNKDVVKERLSDVSYVK